MIDELKAIGSPVVFMCLQQVLLASANTCRKEFTSIMQDASVHTHSHTVPFVNRAVGDAAGF